MVLPWNRKRMELYHRGDAARAARREQKAELRAKINLLKQQRSELWRDYCRKCRAARIQCYMGEISKPVRAGMAQIYRTNYDEAAKAINEAIELCENEISCS